MPTEPYSRRASLSRRGVLAGTVAGLLPSTVACDLLATSPEQGQGGAGKESDSLDQKEAPELAQQVEAGDLPPLRERLPENPMVIEPTERVGPYGGSLRNGLIGANINPYVYTLGAYDQLVRWAEKWTGAPGDAEVLPNVAESYEFNDDFTEFTFTLRKGMRWSDGEPFTAEDVDFAVNDVMLNTDLFPVTPGVLVYGGETGHAELVDDVTIKMVFPGGAGLFLKKLATWDGRYFTILPKHYLRQFHREYNDDVDALVEEEGFEDWPQLLLAKAGDLNLGHTTELPVLWGWMPVECFAEGDSKVRMVRNPYYWKTDPEGRQLPYLDELVWDSVNELDVLVLQTANGDYNFEAGPDVRYLTPANKPVLAQSREKGRYDFVPALDSRYNVMAIFWNFSNGDPVRREVIQNRDFRIGLSHAINRREIIDAAWQRQGEPWQAAPLPRSAFYDEEFATQYLDYDPDLANEYLDRAFPDKDSDGMRLGPDGQRIILTLEFVGDYTEAWPPSVELLREYWLAVGLDIRLKNIGRENDEERQDANQQDGRVWHGEGGMDPTIGRFYGPNAPLWSQWYASFGDAGEEPPEKVRRMMELYRSVESANSAEEQEALITEYIAIAKEEFYVIGTHKQTEKYFVAANNIRNLPKTMLMGWFYPSPGPTRPEQYFIEQ